MKTKRKLLPVAVILCAVSLTAMILVLAAGNNSNGNMFIPPAFDAAAVRGTPDVPDGLGWSPVEAADAFTAYLCGNVTASGQTADVYFANADSNTVWLKLRILDGAGEIIGETGLIRPGEFVKSVELARVPPNGANIKLKIMAYEPETYYSAGTVALNTTIKIGG